MSNQSGRVTNMLKNKFSNEVSKLINFAPEKGDIDYKIKMRLSKLNDQAKLGLLQNILDSYFNNKVLLRSHRAEQKFRNSVNRKRAEKVITGQRPVKARTTKAQYEAMCAANSVKPVDTLA